jgi:hypothetical protein
MPGALSGSAMVMIANSLRGARWMEVYQFASPACVARMSASEIPPSSAEWRMWAQCRAAGQLPDPPAKRYSPRRCPPLHP